MSFLSLFRRHRLAAASAGTSEASMASGIFRRVASNAIRFASTASDIEIEWSTGEPLTEAWRAAAMPVDARGVMDVDQPFTSCDVVSSRARARPDARSDGRTGSTEPPWREAGRKLHDLLSPPEVRG